MTRVEEARNLWIFLFPDPWGLFKPYTDTQFEIFVPLKIEGLNHERLTMFTEAVRGLGPLQDRLIRLLRFDGMCWAWAVQFVPEGDGLLPAVSALSR